MLKTVGPGRGTRSEVQDGQERNSFLEVGRKGLP